MAKADDDARTALSQLGFETRVDAKGWVALGKCGVRITPDLVMTLITPSGNILMIQLTAKDLAF
jgi:hypothetical protein